MPADWNVRHWPRVGFHVFLSHVREDRDSLVVPVRNELQRMFLQREQQFIIPWIDRADFPVGRPSLAALREEILRCRHVVYFITPAMLKQGRGWCALERCVTDIVQSQLTLSGLLFQHVELPLVFCNPDDEPLTQSVWGPLFDRALVYARMRRSPRETRANWAVRMISEFVDRESRWAEDIRVRLRNDPAALERFGVDRNLLRRLRAADPAPATT